jgi:hypothetical protein
MNRQIAILPLLYPGIPRDNADKTANSNDHDKAAASFVNRALTMLGKDCDRIGQEAPA